jgi:hypothetical protein
MRGRDRTCAVMWQGGSAMSGSAAGFHAVRMMRRSSGASLMRRTTSASWSTPWPGGWLGGLGEISSGAVRGFGGGEGLAAGSPTTTPQTPLSRPQPVHPSPPPKPPDQPPGQGVHHSTLHDPHCQPPRPPKRRCPAPQPPNLCSRCFCRRTAPQSGATGSHTRGRGRPPPFGVVIWGGGSARGRRGLGAGGGGASFRRPAVGGFAPPTRLRGRLCRAGNPGGRRRRAPHDALDNTRRRGAPRPPSALCLRPPPPARPSPGPERPTLQSLNI